MPDQSSLFRQTANDALAAKVNSANNNKAATCAVQRSFSEQYDTIGFKLNEIEEKYGSNHAKYAAMHAINAICICEKKLFRQTTNNPNNIK